MEREEIIKIFAANLRAERAKKRYTLEKLAEMARAIASRYTSTTNPAK